MQNTFRLIYYSYAKYENEIMESAGCDNVHQITINFLHCLLTKILTFKNKFQLK